MKNFCQLLYSRNNTERVKLNLSFVIFKRISRHFRGIKIKIFRGSSPPDTPSWLTLTRPPLAPPPPHPVENLLRGPCVLTTLICYKLRFVLALHQDKTEIILDR